MSGLHNTPAKEAATVLKPVLSGDAVVSVSVAAGSGLSGGSGGGGGGGEEKKGGSGSGGGKKTK